ncbi:MAG: putative baseplate assembly protein [Methanotrichaceae archaeon]|nr:putative baseplate assembly protein [Methanotrichaceae archaeon]
MVRRFVCGREGRRARVMTHQTLMGLDYVEVSSDQHTLLVKFLPSSVSGKPLMPEGLTEADFRITGGLLEVRVTGLVSVDDSEGRTICLTVDDDRGSPVSVGDFSTYKLHIAGVSNTDPTVPIMDPILSEVEFSFKAGCPALLSSSPLKARSKGSDAPIDYLSKDYASFRRMMLDRLSVVMPDWTERNPSDLLVALVETLAYAADQLSYFQDAVATEAYLGCARKRISVRRHARLLDYALSDGCNSRAWVAISVEEGASGKEGLLLRGPLKNEPGTRLLSRISGKKTLLEGEQDLRDALLDGALVFETMHDLRLYSDLNRMRFHTWGDEECCLPKGATGATLIVRDKSLLLPGRVIILEEVQSPKTGLSEDADPMHRHPVRLTACQIASDPLYAGDMDLVDVSWSEEDALPFPLVISTRIGGQMISDAAQARGNIVLADHGLTVVEDDIRPSADGRILLERGPISHQGHPRDRLGQPVIGEDGRRVPFDPAAPAKQAMIWETRDLLPSIKIFDGRGDLWLPQRDLLSSDPQALDFVAEIEEDKRASIRFARGLPAGPLSARYRIGNGLAGNVGASAIRHILTPLKGIVDVENPLPAKGGLDMETIEEARLFAPQSFRVSKRAVTEEDYARMAETHPDVQRANATASWTGSWQAMMVAVDRIGGYPVDASFMAELRSFLEPYRMAGWDLVIQGPIIVALEIALNIIVAKGYRRDQVERELYDAFSSERFFHPDNFTFGQSVYLSAILARALDVPGVERVEVDPAKGGCFKRLGEAVGDSIDRGLIEMGRLEIACMVNDPNDPAKGRMEFLMEGGL